MTIFVRTKAIVVAACLAGVPGVLAEAPSGAVVGACHISPIVSDLDKSARFYHELLGMDLMPAPAQGPLPWDTDPGHLNLHGLPNARLRFIQARMPGVRCGIELVEFANVDRRPVRRRYQDPGASTIILMVRDIDSAFAALKNGGARIVTTGGAPIGMSAANRTRAVTVEDPDGHFVELAQIDPAPASTVAAASNVTGIRLRLTVADVPQNGARGIIVRCACNHEVLLPFTGLHPHWYVPDIALWVRYRPAAASGLRRIRFGRDAARRDTARQLLTAPDASGGTSACCKEIR